MYDIIMWSLCIFHAHCPVAVLSSESAKLEPNFHWVTTNSTLESQRLRKSTITASARCDKLWTLQIKSTVTETAMCLIYMHTLLWQLWLPSLSTTTECGGHGWGRRFADGSQQKTSSHWGIRHSNAAMFYICVCYPFNAHVSLPVLLLLYYVVTLKDTTSNQTEVVKPGDSLQTVVASLKKIEDNTSDVHCQ